MSTRIGPGLYLEHSNSNSNSNSNSSNSTNGTLFFRGSNSTASSKKSEWNENVAVKSPNPGAQIRFAHRKTVRRISPSGKSRAIGQSHRTRTRKRFASPIKANITRRSYSAARLVAAAHKPSYSYDEMKEFIEKARAPAAVKEAALRSIRMKYPNFGR
jgi:hypothetical protein